MTLTRRIFSKREAERVLGPHWLHLSDRTLRLCRCVTGRPVLVATGEMVQAVSEAWVDDPQVLTEHEGLLREQQWHELEAVRVEVTAERLEILRKMAAGSDELLATLAQHLLAAGSVPVPPRSCACGLDAGWTWSVAGGWVAPKTGGGS